MRSIGEMGRDSGLGVSALRFYDRAGVLVPAWVDPATGYRWYAPEQLGEARLLARLRRSGMPLADIRLVLAGWAGGDTGLVPRLLDGHLRRLESGLAEAREELSAVRALLGHKETSMTTATATARLTLPGAGLAAALDAVRYAAGTDPELPVLGGIHFDIEGDALHLVATDRYRMAVARTSATGAATPADGAAATASDSTSDSACDPAGHGGGGRVQVTVPLPLADAMRALLTDGAPARLTVDGGRVELETQGRQVAGQSLGEDFPDYRRLTLLPEGRRLPLDVPALRRALGGQEAEVCVLVLTDTVTVGDEDCAGDRVGVNPAYLLDALAAGEELLLEYIGPKAPLVLLRPDVEDAFSLLMPVSLEA
ncbi:DNA polymerase III subunit beta family protein [Streptomyces roseus]|uniref:DNA polymerase III subunit beta n=1 Tax=Streptomyces roseus TaxID=66430 RepID=A0A0J6XNA1_9ACTN|nr:MerR family transcriptional regulator [Streptomyces roseus]KMO96198.1 DNA polymerase III subunit beta [Streptomyces roseus]